ncbi:hypothetical protein K3495_g12201 [Podosphaera aphanis]|nr:hypothetical protein K3495_g12201 [Podosphaera aphanis]
MAARSFKPALYFSRPCYSGSNSRGVRSDETFVATLTSLTMENECDMGSSGGAKRNQCPRSNSGYSTTADLVGKNSIPIAIERPTKTARSYTPLTARGELPGGYFPNHEQIDYRAQYIRGFTDLSRTSNRYSPLDSTNMSTVSSTANSPFFSPQNSSCIPGSSSEPPLIPTGKYHPSIYNSPANTPVKASYQSRYSSFDSLSIPPILSKRDQSRKRHQEHNKLDGTSKKLQQYQRDMIAQAKKAVKDRTMNDWKPAGITLRPTNVSADGITPFELENEMTEYITSHEKNRHEWKEYNNPRHAGL